MSHLGHIPERSAEGLASVRSNDSRRAVSSDDRAEQIIRAVAGLDSWFETMRSPGGYGGPVVHWWQQSFTYAGPGLDWRYEGIIAGYLSLWRNTDDSRWLSKACRAGDDLVAGQLDNGHYRGSAFELNPATAGTPHEAACDVGLLLLARALAEAGRHDPEPYVACAERNLQTYFIDRLWDSVTQSFRDTVNAASFVPNKTATVCEAIFLLAEMRRDDTWVEQYALPSLRRIVTHQINGGPLDGAIAQNSLGTRRIEKYFPIYMARCIPALVQGYKWSGRELLGDSALRAMRFIVGQMDDHGAVPTVVYSKHRTSHGHAWVAPLGDVLRAADDLALLGFESDVTPMLDRLLSGQDASGGIQTATGFATQQFGRQPKAPDVRDVMHVVGWCDKAFRYLAAHVDTHPVEVESKPMHSACTFRGQPMQFRETKQEITISCGEVDRYHWRKGTNWPDRVSPEFWLR